MVLYVLISFGVMVGLFAMWWFTPTAVRDLGPAAATLPKELERARAHGMPLTAKEVRPEASVPDSENAYQDARSIQSMLEGLESSEMAIAARKHIRARDFGGARQQLDRLASAFAALESFAHKPSYDSTYDRDALLALDKPELVTLMTVAKLFGIRSVLRAEEGDVVGALTDLGRTYHFADLPAQDATLLDVVVQTSGRRAVNSYVNEIAFFWRDDSTRLQKLQESLEVLQKPVHLYSALRTEFYFGLALERNLDKYGGPKALDAMWEADADLEDAKPTQTPDNLRRQGIPPGRNEQAYMARFLSAWNDVWPAVQEVDKNPLETFETFEARRDRLAQEVGRSWRAAREAFDSFGPAIQDVVKLRAEEAAVRGLIAVLLYHSEHATWPKDLEEAGVHLTDPFSDGRLRFVVRNGQPVVYSVGPNGKDDGGRSAGDMAKPSGRDDGDLVATVPPESLSQPSAR